MTEKSARIRALATLAEQGATEGERKAATNALAAEQDESPRIRISNPSDAPGDVEWLRKLLELLAVQYGALVMLRDGGRTFYVFDNKAGRRVATKHAELREKLAAGGEEFRKGFFEILARFVDAPMPIFESKIAGMQLALVEVGKR